MFRDNNLFTLAVHFAGSIVTALPPGKARSICIFGRCQAGVRGDRCETQCNQHNGQKRHGAKAQTVHRAAFSAHQCSSSVWVLSATIRARAEDGVEEKRDEAMGHMKRAQDRAARFAHEAAGLTLLVEALRAKRGAAQEAYFGPVQQELAPLLNLLHADAALSFDPSSLLPQGMARAGADETMEMLSGGTQEQIAILTRLAFARLFARQGKPMPVILDDALVYSDDSRIAAMFTALHRVATDQQVIVFSCRQMAFSGLGGTRPKVEITQDR